MWWITKRTINKKYLNIFSYINIYFIQTRHQLFIKLCVCYSIAHNTFLHNKLLVPKRQTKILCVVRWEKEGTRVFHKARLSWICTYIYQLFLMVSQQTKANCFYCRYKDLLFKLNIYNIDGMCFWWDTATRIT